MVSLQLAFLVASLFVFCMILLSANAAYQDLDARQQQQEEEIEAGLSEYQTFIERCRKAGGTLQYAEFVDEPTKDSAYVTECNFSGQSLVIDSFD